MKKRQLKNIALITMLAISLTGCQNKQTTNAESTNNQYKSSSTKHSTEEIKVEEQLESSVSTESNTKEQIENSEQTINSIKEQIENSEQTVNSTKEEIKEEFTYFKEAKKELISYIESEEFSNLKEKGKFYITTGIDFIFFDQPINNIYYKDLKEELKKDVIRDLNSLDQAIMAYYPDYKETFNEKYEIASHFISEKYTDAINSIKEYLNSENYNALIEIKDQIKGDISTKTEEIIEDVKGLYKEWKNN